MDAHLQKWFKGRNWRRTFYVHFILFEAFELDTYLKNLADTYPLEVLDSTDPTRRTVVIRARPKQLQEALRALPHNVAFSYEEKELKKD